MRHLYVAPSIALWVGLACSSTLEPEAVTGTWYLHAYNDSAVPGIAVSRVGRDSSVITIDSVRLSLGTDGTCGWLVALAGAPVSSAATCTWTLDAAPDDLLVTVNDAFQLRGDAGSEALDLRDLNENRLAFRRDPAVQGPVDPTEPTIAARGGTRVTAGRAGGYAR